MVIWLMGISGAGKTTIGKQLVEKLRQAGSPTIFLDGDELRGIWADDLGHTVCDRRRNHQRISRLCKLLEQSKDIVVVVAALSIFPDQREWHRKNFEKYVEVFLDVPIDVAKARDVKGVYKRSTGNRGNDIVGVDITFPRADSADLTISYPEILDPPEQLATSIFLRLGIGEVST